MRKKYADCRRADGDCTICPLVNYGRDCHNRPITKLEWSRRMAGMTQAELAEASGVNIRQIQRVELGEAESVVGVYIGLALGMAKSQVRRVRRWL